MKALFSALVQELRQDRRAVLCGILSSAGSTPRRPGALMAVLSGGKRVGTIGGGALEERVWAEALLLLAGDACRLRTFRLADAGTPEHLNMACGGEVTVSLQVLGPPALPLIHAAEEALAHPVQDVWLVSVVEEGGPWRMGLYDSVHGLRFTSAIPVETLCPLLISQSVFLPGQPGLWVQPLVRRGDVYLFGGGHVGAELCPLLHRVGFRVTVCDDRPDFAQPERFPQAEQVLLVDYRSLPPSLSLTERDYVAIMTSGHQGDLEILRQVLSTTAAYIGCIGSRRKAAILRERLSALGLSQRDLDRVYSPIGLPLGGDTPAEIAVSIAAQLIAHRAGRLSSGAGLSPV